MCAKLVRELNRRAWWADVVDSESDSSDAEDAVMIAGWIAVSDAEKGSPEGDGSSTVAVDAPSDTAGVVHITGVGGLVWKIQQEVAADAAEFLLYEKAYRAEDCEARVLEASAAAGARIEVILLRETIRCACVALVLYCRAGVDYCFDTAMKTVLAQALLSLRCLLAKLRVARAAIVERIIVEVLTIDGFLLGGSCGDDAKAQAHALLVLTEQFSVELSVLRCFAPSEDLALHKFYDGANEYGKCTWVSSSLGMWTSLLYECCTVRIESKLVKGRYPIVLQEVLDRSRFLK